MTAPFLNRVRQLAAPHGVEHVGGLSLEGMPLLAQARHKIPSQARSAVMLLFPYYTGPLPQRNISRYAAIPDYHIVAMDILKEICIALAQEYPDGLFVPLIDSSPIPEVWAAAACGLGVVGRHGMLIHPEYGSYVFIGEILTDLELEPAGKVQSCIDCGACAVRCPGAAITQGVQRERCLSHLTQKKGELPPEIRELMKQEHTCWGCDACLENCPMNRTNPTPIRGFYEDTIPQLTEETLPRLLEHACGWRGEGVLRRNLEVLEPLQLNEK